VTGHHRHLSPNALPLSLSLSLMIFQQRPTSLKIHHSLLCLQFSSQNPQAGTCDFTKILAETSSAAATQKSVSLQTARISQPWFQDQLFNQICISATTEVTNCNAPGAHHNLCPFLLIPVCVSFGYDISIY
jgi:hypothetical protein